jgi:hypothetical protein
VSTEVASRLFDRLADQDGLTATASTFARQDVIAALGGQLAGATRPELEELADRFLAERTVAVVADRALEEHRWSTPELLATEQRLVEAAPSAAPATRGWRHPPTFWSRCRSRRTSMMKRTGIRPGNLL